MAAAELMLGSAGGSENPVAVRGGIWSPSQRISKETMFFDSASNPGTTWKVGLARVGERLDRGGSKAVEIQDDPRSKNCSAHPDRSSIVLGDPCSCDSGEICYLLPIWRASTTSDRA